MTYTVIAQTGSAATGNLVNTATVTAPAGVTDAAGNNSATDTDTATPLADVADASRQPRPGHRRATS